MAQLATGDVLAGYRIEGLAGRGGMGVVYRATQLALDRPVALKLITPELAQDEGFRERFKRESRIAAGIEHPHVIPVHDSGEADGQLYIAMRFIEGLDLGDVIRGSGPVEPRRAARLVSQVASALDAAHARGLVHRDIKPGNVLIASEEGMDHAYLTDFGLSKRLASQTAVTTTGMWVGTVDYISPEQIRGGEPDARSDVYSLGCLLYHALTGQVPFAHDSDVAKIFAHMSEPPPRPSMVRASLPGGLDEVVDRALAKDPADRYPSAGDLARATVAAVEGRPVSAAERSVAKGQAAPAPAPAPATLAPAGAGTGAPRRGADRRTVALAAALLVATVVAILGVAGVFSGDDEGGGGGSSAFAEGAVTLTPIAVDSPNGLAIGDGQLWVSSYARARINRIDLESGAVGEPIAVGNGPSSIAVADGTVWVVNSDENTVSRVDLERGEVVGNPITVSSTATGDSIAAGDGKAWVATPSDGRVVPIDAESGKPGRTIAPPDGAIGELAFGEGGVWVLGDAGTVARIDPATGEPGEAIKVADKLPADDEPFRGHLAVGEGAVWVAALDDETVVRVDPESGEVAETISIEGGIEGDIAAADGSVWVTNESGGIIRIDPQTNTIAGRTLPTGPDGAADIVAGADAVWVAGSTDTNTVTRVAP